MKRLRRTSMPSHSSLRHPRTKLNRPWLYRAFRDRGRNSQSTDSLSPHPNACCNQGATDRSMWGKGCGTCKLRVRSWSWNCWIWFGLAAKIHSWQWKHFRPFRRCWGSPPSALKLSLNFLYDLILHKAPDESGVPSSSLVEGHSPCFLNNPWSATTGTCLANRFPT